ncbi:class I SAM-dependent methyltransferase [bacterium]|nr:class I SAM-dependent methyltransferase [bacterium]
MRCPLCGGPAQPFAASTRKTSRTYHRCGSCGFVALAPSARLSRAEEKARYLLHDNDPADRGYRDFVGDFVRRAIIPFAAPGDAILDFGSGPRPLLAATLAELGYHCDLYDPCFAATRAWRRRTYGLVALHEVAEHIAKPGAELAFLAGRVAPGGAIAIRTRFQPSLEEDFDAWWYRMDPAHVSFYTPSCLERFFGGFGFVLAFLAPPDTIVFRKTALG